MMTPQELELIRDALFSALRQTVYLNWNPATVEAAIEIVRREIHQMKQDQILSVSRANPT